MKNPIHQTAQFITSSAAVTLGLLVIIMAMIFETQTLLYYQLQSVGMQGYKLYFTSFGLSIGIEFIILLFTANSKVSTEGQTESKWKAYRQEPFFTAPVVFGISSFIINFYFWKAYDFSRSIEWIVFSIFISWLLAYINFKLSELFISKWSAHLKQVDLEVKCSELQMNQTQLKVKLTQVSSKYDELKSTKKSQQEKFEHVMNEYNSLRKEADEMRDKLSRKKKKQVA